jgi:benzoyl-CoA reductase/2-hydroxyglutaryl-CoA dehydratase subunit BcrC/BadD/HgdB
MDKPTIAYTCSYVPVEIIMACGLSPQRIVPQARPVDAESHLHANTCCYVKSLLAEALEKGLPGMHGIVFANSCDGMRRLYDLWGRYVKDPPALFFDIPKKKDPESIAFFASELKRLASRVETQFHGQAITEERLNTAIRDCNHVRQMMADVLVHNGHRGSELFALCLQGTQLPIGDFAEVVREYRTRVANDRGPKTDKRLIVTGNILTRPDLIELIEETGGKVVALDTCTGARQYDTLVDEVTPRPFEALSRRYLTRPPCARMMGFEEQFVQMKAISEKHSAQGIICSTVKYCDALLYTVPLLQQRFRDLNIPVLWLENDYTWTDLAQIRTRVETFIDMLTEAHHV